MDGGAGMRYIDADKLVAWCMATYQAQSTTEGKAYVNAFLTKIDSCPTVDAVEVVRCKDCTFYEPHGMYGGLCRSKKSRGVWHPTDYCSCGERREV